MGFKKTLLFFSLFLLVAIPFYFFLILVPFSKFNSLYSQAPVLVNNLINKTYPEDLIIDIKNGQVSVNQKTPYCLILDDKSKFGILFDENAQATNFINEKNTNYPNSCKPEILVGKNFIVYPDTESKTQGSYKIQQISSSTNYRITRDEITNLSSSLLPQLMNFARYAYYLAPFVLALLALSWFLQINLWYALIAWALMKLTKTNINISYKETYAKSLFVLLAYTAFKWILISLVVNSLLHLKFGISFPFLTTIVVAAGTIIMEKYYYKKNQPKTLTKQPVV